VLTQLPFCGTSSQLTNSNQSPIEFLFSFEFEISDTRWRASIRSCNTARIQEANTANHLVARNVSVTVQKNITIFRWPVRRRRNVLQTKPHALSDEVKTHWPRNLAVAVSAHNRYRWPKQAQLVQLCWSTDIAQMPNF